MKNIAERGLRVWDYREIDDGDGDGPKMSLHPLPASLSEAGREGDPRGCPLLSVTTQDSVWIPPLRSLSHVKKRDLTGSGTAAKGVPANVKHSELWALKQVPNEADLEKELCRKLQLLSQPRAPLNFFLRLWYV